MIPDNMEVNIADLTWSFFIYPRGSKNEKTVEAYVEALRIGAQFRRSRSKEFSTTPERMKRQKPH
jgi:hypothetical protein